MAEKSIVFAKIIYCKHNEYGIINIVSKSQFVPLRSRTVIIILCIALACFQISDRILVRFQK